ncbi:MAG: peptidylprolyl isomerase [Dehalococcoidia bacterium]
MKSGIVLSAVILALLLAACALPTPTPPPTPLSPEGPPTIRIADTPTPPRIGTPTPVLITRPDGTTFKEYSEPPAMIIDPQVNYTATIVTNLGAIEIDLFASETPVTVNNFVFLAREKFYDGVIFHRVIPNFMIQGGDPRGQGTGGPGYKFQDEIVPSLTFDGPGILAMANAGPGTNGSQFFITVAATPHLTGAHTIFGRVTQGQEVVNAIATTPRNRRDAPLDDVVIETIKISPVG